MQLDDLHPLDRDKARILAERLCDVSLGCDIDRADLHYLVSSLMFCTSPTCSAAGADDVVDRLLTITDWRLGRDGVAEAVLVEISTEQACRGA